jgi:hypothetical protein
MTYAQSSVIVGTDYNTFVQGGDTVNHNVANINSVWGVGNGNKGYGQSTTLASVASTNTITATQWSNLIARLNSILTHQAGSGSGISAPTSGTTIAYLSALSGSITTGYNNRLTAATNGTDITNTTLTTAWNTATPTTFTVTRTATFASADAARYFFNAGGKLIINLSGTDNLSNSKGTDWVSLLGTKFASLTFGATTNGRNGSGGTVSSSNTSLGYWNLTTSDQAILTLTSASGTADYSSNNIVVNVKSNGVQGSNGDVGSVITFTITLNDPAADTNTAPPGIPAYTPAGTAPSQGNFNDAINLTVSSSITVRPPESTNITNTWGTVTQG